MDITPNGHNPEWAQSRIDTIPNGHHTEWTPYRMDIPSQMNTCIYIVALVFYNGSYCLVRSLLQR